MDGIILQAFHFYGVLTVNEVCEKIKMRDIFINTWEVEQRIKFLLKQRKLVLAHVIDNPKNETYYKIKEVA